MDCDIKAPSWPRKSFLSLRHSSPASYDTSVLVVLIDCAGCARHLIRVNNGDDGVMAHR